jgi:hypothetical protein
VHSEGIHSAAPNAYVSAWRFVAVYLGLGETEKAFYRFDRVLDECNSMILTFHIVPNWEPLHARPRCKALLRKKSLEQ